MTERSPDPARLSPAEILFVEWMRDWSPGAERKLAELDEICHAHPGHAAALGELVERLRQLATEAEPRSFFMKLHERHGSGVDPRISLGDQESPGYRPASSPLIERLAEHGPRSPRYTIHGELARGGMGAILEVFDEDLRRKLAMKVILGKSVGITSGQTPPVDRRLLARFLEEAQVTGQLDHPGIVPVHELGLDSDGRVFFTMKLVKGRDLKSIFELVFARKEDWNETRALSVLLKVCEAVAYAHKKGVIHRDLKPANVMIGGFGEVYVMDWGLARVLGRADTHDLRLRDDTPALTSVKTERRAEREEAPDSPLFTMDGDVVGTPCYMPPEQARGEVERLGPRSDVYSIGAMLYHLLARRMPYVLPGERISNRTVLAMVLRSSPIPLHELRRDVPAELEAICDKAMAREPERRYVDTLELAEDLRAYLEGRVVRAHRTGALVELSKWTRRNRGLAAALTSAMLALIGGLCASLALKARSDGYALLAAERQTLAEDRRREAETSRQLAETNARDARREAYVSSIRAAEAAFRLSETANVSRALESACVEFRNWEWSHLMARADCSLKVLRASERDVLTATFSPDGSRVLTGLADGTARLWDAGTGVEVTVMRGHASDVTQALFSEDGTRILTVSKDRTIRLWDAAGRPELSIQLEREPSSVAWSSDGSRILTLIRLGDRSFGFGEDHVFYLFDALSGARIASAPARPRDPRELTAEFSPDGHFVILPDGTNRPRLLDARTGGEVAVLQHRSAVRCVAFSPDGSLLATGSNEIRLWDLATLEPFFLGEPECGATSLCFSHDGLLLVSASTIETQRKGESEFRTDTTAQVWDIASRSERFAFPHEVAVVRSQFSHNDSRLLTVTRNGKAGLWDTAKGDEVAILQDPDDPIRVAAFAPDGASLVTLSGGENARVWHSASGSERAVLRGHEKRIRSCSFSLDGSRLLTSSVDGTARLWDTRSTMASFVQRIDVGSCCEAISSDGDLAIGCAEDDSARLWDLAKGVEVFRMPLAKPSPDCEGGTGWSWTAAFSPDRSSVAITSSSLCDQKDAASDRHRVSLWSILTGDLIANLRDAQQSGPLRSEIAVYAVSATFSPDSKLVATTTLEDQVARLLDSTGAERTVLEHDGPVKIGAFSPDGSRLLTLSQEDGTAWLWGAQGGTLVARLDGHEARIMSCAFDLDGSKIVTGSQDDTARVWDGGTGALLRTLQGHHDAVTTAVFSPAGTTIATASDDGTARIWDAGTGAALATLLGHEGAIETLDFSPDGSRIVTGSSDGTVRLWDPSTGAELLSLDGGGDVVEHAFFTVDGTRIVTSTRDGMVSIWHSVPLSIRQTGPDRRSGSAPR